MTKCLLCIGYGFSAQALTADLQQQGWDIIGTTRSESRANEMHQAGVKSIIWPGNDLNRALTCLLYTSPSPRDVEESRMPSSA